MRTLILIVIGLLVVGCEQKESPAAKEPVKEPTLGEKLVGTYELDGDIIVFQKSGMMESYAKGRKEGGEYKWKIVDKEVHAVTKGGGGRAWGINPDGSLIYLAVIQSNGNKLYLPRLPKIGNTDYQPYWKKITNYKDRVKKVASLKERELKTEEKESALNSDNKNSTSEKPTKELTKEDVVGSYEAGLGGITFRFVLLDSGVVENYFNGQKEPEDAKWKIQGAEVHIEKGKSDGTVIVNKIEPNGDFTVFARIRNGKREAFQNRTYKKIKDRSEAPKTFSEIDTLLRNRKGKSKSDFETVKRYLSSGVDVNRRNKSGGIILHIAAVQGDKRLVSLLLSKGAKVNAKNNIGKTPLDLAIDLKRTETIALLRKYGANTSAGLKAEGKAVKKLTLKERVAGSYEPTFGNFEPGSVKYIFHENGKFENWQNGKIVEASKWKIVGKEIHVDDFESDTYIYIIESNGNLTEIAVISDGKRQGLPKGRYKKIK